MLHLTVTTYRVVCALRCPTFNELNASDGCLWLQHHLLLFSASRTISAALLMLYQI